MADFLKYDRDNVITKGARVLLAPSSASLPDDEQDIYSPYLADDYDPVPPWWDAGATSAATQVSRNLTITDINIQQSDIPIFREPTAVVRQIAVPFAEFSSAMLEVLEQSGLVETAGHAKKVHHGSILELTSYRIAVALRKSKLQGLVIEGAGGHQRGRDLVFVGYNATISGDNVQMSFGRGDVAGGTLTFDLSPDPNVSQEGTETGFWLLQDAQTLPTPS